MLTVPDNRNEDNPVAADASTTVPAGEGVGSGGADGPMRTGAGWWCGTARRRSAR